MDDKLKEHKDFTPKVDASLARGLGTHIKKMVEASNQSNLRVLRTLFGSKSTMPTTKKGAVRLHRELDKHMRKCAFSGLNPSSGNRFGMYFRWAVNHDEVTSDWKNDTVSVEMMLIDLMSQSPSVGAVLVDVHFTMHAIERIFLRLNTTDYATVLQEIERTAFLCTILKHSMQRRCMLEGLREVPVFYPTKNGAVVGDFIVSDDEKSAKYILRSFIGGKADMTEAKEKLRDDLNQWVAMFDSSMYAAGAYFVPLKYDSEDLQEAFEQDLGMFSVGVMVFGYFDICRNNILGTGDKQKRRGREDKLRSMWDSRLGK